MRTASASASARWVFGIRLRQRAAASRYIPSSCESVDDFEHQCRVSRPSRQDLLGRVGCRNPVTDGAIGLLPVVVQRREVALADADVSQQRLALRTFGGERAKQVAGARKRVHADLPILCRRRHPEIEDGARQNLAGIGLAAAGRQIPFGERDRLPRVPQRIIGPALRVLEAREP